MPPRTPPGIRETRSRQFLLLYTRHLRTLEGRRLAPQLEKSTRNKPCSFPPWNEITVLRISSSYSGGCLRVTLALLGTGTTHQRKRISIPNLLKTVPAIDVPIVAALTRSITMSTRSPGG